MKWHFNDISQNNLTKSAIWNKMFGMPYFEGWYHKLTCPKTKTFFLIIFGYVCNTQKKFAFIQVASSIDGKQHFFSFPVADLIISKSSVQIGENYFTNHEIVLNLPNIQVHCNNQNEQVNTKKKSLIGLKKFVPFVDCKHEVICLDEKRFGIITYKDRTLDGVFRYYAETSWGQDFPKRYFWLHANCFENCANTSFLIAQAEPKFLGWKTKQHLGYLKHKGTTYVFRTGNTKVKLDADAQSVQLSHKKVIVNIRYKNGIPVTLKGPFNGNMENNVVEHIQAPVTIDVRDKKGMSDILYTHVATWEIR